MCWPSMFPGIKNKVATFTYMTSMNGMNSLKISKAAIRNGCN